MARSVWPKAGLVCLLTAAMSAAMAPLPASAMPPVGGLVLVVTDCKTGATIAAGEADFSVVGFPAGAVASIENGRTGTIGLGDLEFVLTVTSPGYRELHRRLHGTGDLSEVRTIALCLHPVDGSPEHLVTTTFNVSVTCSPASGQLCNPPYAASVETSDILRMQFTASAAHCSSITVDFFVDGFLVFTSDPLGPDESTPLVDVGPVSPGAHEVAVQATGVPGGCNAGTLAAWAGNLTVLVALPVGPTTREQCKNGGWRNFTEPLFTSEGDCVHYVSTAGKHA